MTVKDYRGWQNLIINLETNTFQFCTIEHSTNCSHFTSWPLG